jgi:hypothetical protein
MKTLVDYYKSMSKKDRAVWGRIFRERKETTPNVQTVAEYIATHDVKTEKRISKKGVELIKVYYPTGAVKEYETRNIDRTNAFEY